MINERVMGEMVKKMEMEMKRETRKLRAKAKRRWSRAVVLSWWSCPFRGNSSNNKSRDWGIVSVCMAQ